MSKSGCRYERRVPSGAVPSRCRELVGTSMTFREQRMTEAHGGLFAFRAVGARST